MEGDFLILVMKEIIKNPDGTFAVYDGNALISDGWTTRENAEQSRGGSRKGAGRKPRSVARVAITLRVEPEIAERFRAVCEAKGRSQSDQFAAMVARLRK